MSVRPFERASEQSDPILERLLDLHPKKIDLSLGRIERLLRDLGAPQAHLPPVIHVAGTNGKGSSIAFMRAILEAAGKRVHVYTSPHLVRFHERIRLGQQGGGRLVDDADLAATLSLCEKVNAGASITFFEITTAAAFVLFSRNPADYLLLEVGLGGRVDATNVVDRPAASLITPVSMDHPEFLGATIPEIAREKAGILKRGVPAVLGFQQPDALKVLEAQAAEVGAPLHIAGQDFFVREEHGRLIYEDERGLLDLPLPRLAGRHQHQNAAGAIAALRLVVPDLATSALETGLATADWPARLQRLSKGNLVALAPAGTEIWLDGAHNEDGARVLAQAMADREEKAPRPLVLITGTLATKDTGAVLRAFKGLAQEVLAVPVHGEHAARTPGDVAALANAEGVPAVACESVESALRFLTARKWALPPRVLIAGSLYLAGEVLRLNGTPPQ
ncbi:MAG: bifunctional folylpolyglutamate synthase/dihydrofolate synthase [Methylovirgula sp.]|nr:bifunctional folylpolyglutamate synthase/dihydrofolate synthase [Methylovirgula sp.]